MPFEYVVIFLTLLVMKISLKIILLGIGNCFATILLGQNSLDKEYVVKFHAREVRISRQTANTIDSIAVIMKNDTSCIYVFSGWFTCNPKMSNLTWDRINNVIARLVTRHKINPERLIFMFDESAYNCDQVFIRPTLEKIVAVAPPPPNLRKKINAQTCQPESLLNY
jgi:hypothetical protein